MVRDCCRHRDHAIVEQVIAELKDGPLAHAPSGKFTANAAWLTLACLSFNVLRAATCCEPPAPPPRPGTPEPGVATLRTHLIDLPARIATSARRITLHLPRDWPWQPAWQDLWATATHP